MRSISFPKSVVALLAIALAAPAAAGCAAETQPQDVERLGTAKEAITPVDGAKAALQVFSMISNMKFQTDMKDGTAEILQKLDDVEADLDALKAALSETQSLVTQADKDVLNVQAMKITDNIVRLFQGYRNVAKSSDPNAIPTYLDQVRFNTTGLGTLDWTDLDFLNDLLVGKKGSSSLIALVGQVDAKRGTAGIQDNALGQWMAEKFLVQQEAFLLLSLANEKNPAIVFADEVVAQQSRIADQQKAFLEATEAYNQALLTPLSQARVGQVTSCEYNDLTLVGIPVMPDSGYYRFKDNACSDWSCKYIYDIRGPGGCNDARNALVNQLTADLEAPARGLMYGYQDLYNVLNLLGTYRAPGDTATVTMVDIYTVKWTNSANESWNLGLVSGHDMLSVQGGPSGYPTHRGDPVTSITFNAKGWATGILGPNGYVYNHYQPERK
jgi:hypothetical protein